MSFSMFCCLLKLSITTPTSKFSMKKLPNSINTTKNKLHPGEFSTIGYFPIPTASTPEYIIGIQPSAVAMMKRLSIACIELSKFASLLTQAPP